MTMTLTRAHLLSVIQQGIDANPRSLQTAIGPSSLGDPCRRAVLNGLAGSRGIRSPWEWQATIGTAAHAWLAEHFGRLPGYLVEKRVSVGTLYDGTDISGTSDLFIEGTGRVVDWKVVGDSTLDRVRLEGGPGPTYRTQVHLYGRGMVRAGYDVHNVSVMFLPRNRQLVQALFWEEPYKPEVAEAALARADGLLQLLHAVGLERAESMYEPCGRFTCWWCPTVRRIKPTLAQQIAPPTERIAQ